MELRNLLPLNNVLFDFAAEGQREIFQCLMAPLAESGVVADTEAFLRNLERREAQVTTQIETGVAFPHARSSAVRRLGITVGIIKPPGLVFNPEAAEPVRVFFLIAIPAFAPTAHLPLLQRLVNYIHDPNRKEKLMNSRTPGQVLKHLATYKGKKDGG